MLTSSVATDDVSNDDVIADVSNLASFRYIYATTVCVVNFFLRQVTITPRLKRKEKGREDKGKLMRSERQFLLNSAIGWTQN